MEYITLSNGRRMPAMVMSTYEMDYPLMKEMVRAGLAIGYRAFDTARDYGNEAVVGRVISECLREAGLAREDIFITTKIGNSQQSSGDIAGEIDRSLQNLRTDYVDIWLMHWPYPGYHTRTYRGMEAAYRAGKARGIGMANYSLRHFAELLSAGIEIMPHCVQHECHPLRTTDDVIAFCRQHDIAVQAYAPLCQMVAPLREAPVLQALAAKYGRTIGQIVLRWHIERGTVPVFGSLKPARLAENFAVWDFSLEPNEVAAISALNADYKCWIESIYCPGY